MEDVLWNTGPFAVDGIRLGTVDLCLRTTTNAQYGAFHLDHDSDSSAHFLCHLSGVRVTHVITISYEPTSSILKVDAFFFRSRAPRSLATISLESQARI